jgi:V8-like Glu-specific endopeptidase
MDPEQFTIDPYGVPLSKDEVADLLHRGFIQYSLESAVEVARASAFFAGVYLDQVSGGQPVFMFTEKDARAEAELVRALPNGTEFRVEMAGRTEKDLLGLKDRIDRDLASLLDEGIVVAQVAFKASRNTLLVGVVGLTDQAAESLSERYGPDLVFYEDVIAEDDACSGGSNNCRPIKGGLAIGTSSPLCTSGFVVHPYDVDAWYVLTAGHCIANHGGYGQVWVHNSNRFGLARRETYTAGGTGTADIGLILIDSSETALMPSKNQIRRTNSTVTAVRAITGGSIEGFQACRVGITSGHQCGQVTHYPATRLSEVTGYAPMTVNPVATYNFDSTGGDSGGPVFFYWSAGGQSGGTSGPEISALGTHVHSEPDGPTADESWYSPIQTGSNAYELQSGGFAYRPCLTAACLN